MTGAIDAPAAIENPVINSPFVEPARHFAFGADGRPTGEIAEGRRPCEFFVPVAQPKKRSGQTTLDLYGGLKKQQSNELVNEIRQAVGRWRTVNSTVSRPFPGPKSGKIAIKVINHYGDEVMKMFGA